MKVERRSAHEDILHLVPGEGGQNLKQLRELHDRSIIADAVAFLLVGLAREGKVSLKVSATPPGEE